VAQIVGARTFGFLLLERSGAAGDWAITAYRNDMSVLTRCTLASGRQLRCDPVAPSPAGE
jgi:hypothetical protein